MNKYVIIFALVALVSAEPPSGNYGAPQYSAPQYSAPQYSAPQYSAPAYESYDDSASYVNDELLARVAQLLEQSESSGYHSSPSSGYGAPSSGYGAPTRSFGIRLSAPERAQRIAEFDLTETRSGGYSGGYSSGGY